jgi:hypothetical protein
MSSSSGDLVKPFTTEKDLQESVAQWFDHLEIPHQRHPTINAASIPDFAMHFSKGSAWGLVELKNGLHMSSFSVSDAAGYFEQCLKYRMQSDLPVFLGPFFSRQDIGALDPFFIGGAKAYTTAAFSSLCGRADVGCFFITAPVPGREHDWTTWTGFTFTLRNQIVASFTKWPSAPITMVCLKSSGSNHLRVAA